MSNRDAAVCFDRLRSAFLKSGLEGLVGGFRGVARVLVFVVLIFAQAGPGWAAGLFCEGAECGGAMECGQGELVLEKDGCCCSGGAHEREVPLERAPVVQERVLVEPLLVELGPCCFFGGMLGGPAQLDREWENSGEGVRNSGANGRDLRARHFELRI